MERELRHSSYNHTKSFVAHDIFLPGGAIFLRPGIPSPRGSAATTLRHTQVLARQRLWLFGTMNDHPPPTA